MRAISMTQYANFIDISECDVSDSSLAPAVTSQSCENQKGGGYGNE